MSVVVNGVVIESALWQQGDARDPLGVWGCRQGATGDATGGSIKCFMEVPEERRSAYVYTCYSAQVSQIGGTLGLDALVKTRLLTNWPNIDEVAGVQGYATNHISIIGSDADFTQPQAGPRAINAMTPFIFPLERFLLLFDPRASASGDMGLVEMEIGLNTDTAVFSFEAYGYFWDRGVMNAPGGPRHPGSS